MDGESEDGQGPVWVVCRQDDHGHRSVVQIAPTQEAARRLVELFEARGHKQTYWAERRRTGGDERTAPV
jgi:hypothetical protein